MQNMMNKELYIYLSEILDLLCKEKLSITNNIDSLIANIKLNDYYNK